MTSIPILTIDGPSGTGKGTLMQLLAERLGWHALDSGALYRALGLAAARQGLDLDDPQALIPLATALPVEFQARRVLLSGEDVTDTIRTEEAGLAASRVAAHPGVRAALLDRQRHFARLPGLVADGRDLGTVVFPQARLKIFLDASPEVRAERRYKQLKEKGLNANLARLVADIRERDARDRSRPVAPLCPAEDAVLVDSTQMSIAEVLDRVLEEVRRVFPEAIA
ncbi:(d)CMP kinase [Thermochromatium tepidum]|uniref:Cytidylate kinase n=1 Tax=Thermochromatium tepidum ATCC 43061 TaxID=316276 RepID=A0A6I6EIS4_THETI|nr:(d)CMP kinase [Thermochromatium tepidum]QGU33037.1 (d)CMP kinase [Thermochromatium tepidum ATCC 43061]